jgi:hypothetical protein
MDVDEPKIETKTKDITRIERIGLLKFHLFCLMFKDFKSVKKKSIESIHLN